jgi:hypothetical protein
MRRKGGKLGGSALAQLTQGGMTSNVAWICPYITFSTHLIFLTCSCSLCTKALTLCVESSEITAVTSSLASSHPISLSYPRHFPPAMWLRGGNQSLPLHSVFPLRNQDVQRHLIRKWTNSPPMSTPPRRRLNSQLLMPCRFVDFAVLPLPSLLTSHRMMPTFTNLYQVWQTSIGKTKHFIHDRGSTYSADANTEPMRHSTREHHVPGRRSTLLADITHLLIPPHLARYISSTY